MTPSMDTFLVLLVISSRYTVKDDAVLTEIIGVYRSLLLLLTVAELLLIVSKTTKADPHGFVMSHTMVYVVPN